MNYVIFHELCDRMQFEVDCAKLHHRVISEGLNGNHIADKLYQDTAPARIHATPPQPLLLPIPYPTPSAK